MQRITKIFLIIGMMLFLNIPLFAQLSNIDIKGAIDDLNTGAGLGGVTVSLYKDGTLIETVTTSSNGKYKFKKTTAGGIFTVKFSKSGYVGKYAEIDTKGIHPEDAGDLPLEVNTSIFEQIPDVDFSILDTKPVAKAKYDKNIDNIEWDITYIEKTKKEVEKIIAKAEEIKKAQADAAAATDKKFNDAVAAANAAASSGDFATAIKKYNEALTVKDDADVKKKLADAEEKKKAADAKAETDKKYNDLMAEAKKFFDAKDYASAKQKYQDASAIKSTETAPKEKIKEIDAILTKNMEDENKYNKYLADGEKAMLASNYDEAIKQFTEAGKMRPSETLPKEELKKAQDAKAAAEKDALAEKKKKEDFEKFVAAADASNAAKKYDEAIASYDKALALIDDPAVKTKKENAIKAKEADALAKQKEEEEKEKERIRKEEYDKLMKKGSEEMTAAEYEKAIGTFESALIIFPKDVPAETKLAEAKKKLADKLANDKLAEEKKKNQEKFDALIEKGDGELAKVEYDKAIATYKEALVILKDDPTGKAKLADAEKKKADYVKNKADFDKLVSEGDAASTGKKFDEAIAKYEKALVLFQDAAVQSKLDKAKSDKDAANSALEAEKKKKEDFNALLAKGDGEVKSESFDAAISTFEEALKLIPKEPSAESKLADAKAKKEAKEKAELANKEKAAQQEKFNQLIAQGDAEMSAATYDKAIASYTAALAIIKDDAGAKTKLADAQKKKDEIAKNKADFDKLVSEGDVASSGKKFDEAITKYEKALGIISDAGVQSKLDKAKADRDAALGALEAEKKKKEDFAALILKGDGEVKSESFDDAISTFEEALKIFPDDAGAKSKLADAKSKKEAKEKAELANKEKAAKQEQFNQLIAQGDNEMSASTFDKAITSYTAALAIFKDDAGAKAKLAEAQKKKNEADLANKNAEEQKRLAEEKYKKHYNDGMTHSNAGEFETAIVDFEAALVIKPGDADATKALENAKENQRKRKEELDAAYNQRIQVADKLFNEGNYAEAKTHYVKANSQRPSDDHPKNRIVECDTKIKEKEQADAKATEKRNNYNAAKAKADELFKASRWDESIKEYEVALTFLDEQYPKDQIALAKSNRDAALNALEAEKKKREDFNALIKRGDSEVWAEDFNTGIATFEEALRLFPKDPTAEEKLADAKNKKIAAEKAEQANKEKAAKREQFNKLMAQGDEEMNASTFDKAISSYTAALAIFKDDVGAKEKLAEAQKKKNEADLALKNEAEQKRLAEENYKKHYNAGMTFSNSSEFEKAITEFEAALVVKPGDKDATDALETARKRLEDYKQMKDQAYKDRVALADKLFDEGNYAEAKTNYEKANKNRPDDEHPKNRIKECNDKLAEASEMKKLREQFDAAMKNGDTELNAKNFDKAIAFYEAAKIILPKETTPDIKIEEAKRLKEKAKEENSLAAKRKQFDALMNEGQTFMNAGEFDSAIEKFEAALKVIPNEPTAEEALKLAKQRKKEHQEEIDREKKRILEFADKEFAASNWKDAKKYYEKYLKYEKNDAYAISQIEKCNAKIKEGETNIASAGNYDALIKAGNKLLGEKKYKDSRAKFVDALAIYPTMSYPQKKIDEIDAILADLAKAQAIKDKKEQNQATQKLKQKSFDYGEKTMLSADDALALLMAAKLDDENDKYEVIRKKKEQISSENQEEAKNSETSRNENYKDLSEQKDKMIDYSSNTDLIDGNTELFRKKKEQLEKETKIWNSEDDLDRKNKADIQALHEDFDMMRFEEKQRFINSKEINAEKDALVTNNHVIDSKAANTREKNGDDLVKLKDLTNDQFSANGNKLISDNAAEVRKDHETLISVNKDLDAKAGTVRGENKEDLRRDQENFARQNITNQEKLLVEHTEKTKNDFLNQHSTNQYILSRADQNRLANGTELNQTKDDFANQNRMISDQLLKENAAEVKGQFDLTNKTNQELNGLAAETRNSNGEKLVQKKDDFAAQQKTTQEILLADNSSTVKSEFDNQKTQNNLIDSKAAETRTKNGQELVAQKDIFANSTNNISDELLSKNGEEVKSDYETLNNQNDQIDQSASNVRNENGKDLKQQGDNLKVMYEKGAESQADKVKKLKEQQDELAKQQKVADEKASKNRWSNGQDLNEQKDKDMVYEKGEEGYKSVYTVDFPQGVTEEVYTRKDADGNVSEVTLRRIVVKGDYGNEYRKVVSKTGTYYFKNGKTITNQTWDMETAK